MIKKKSLYHRMDTETEKCGKLLSNRGALWNKDACDYTLEQVPLPYLCLFLPNRCSCKKEPDKNVPIHFQR